MENTLVVAAVACLIAAIVGGGLRAFGVEIPVLASGRRQAMLGLLGIILLFSGVSLSRAAAGRSEAGRSDSIPTNAAGPPATGDSLLRGPTSFLLDKAWPPNSEIKIGFVNGSAAQRQKVRSVADEWLHFANVKFSFGSARSAAVRIQFSNDVRASWSFRGTENLAVPQHCPTMILGGITDTPTISLSDQALILHEFGHVLGLVDEIQNPNGNIPWKQEVRDDPNAIYLYVTDVENCPTVLNRHVTWKNPLPRYRAFDPHSIMMAEISGALLNENSSLGSRGHLSMSDRSFIGQIYPGKAP